MSFPKMTWQLQFALLSMIWGSSFLLIKYALPVLAPTSVAAGRIITGAVVLMGIAAVQCISLPRSRRIWWHMTMTSLFLTAIPFTLFSVAEETVSSGIASIANATSPFSMAVLTAVLLRTERLTPRVLAMLATGFCGVILIAQPWSTAAPDPVGLLCAVGAATSYSVGWVYNRRFVGRDDVGGLAMPTMTMITGAVLSLIIVGCAAALGTPPLQPGTHDASAWAGAGAAVLALGAFGTGLAYVLFYDVVREVGPTRGGFVTFVMPVVALLLGAVFLGEHMNLLQYLGATVVLGSAIVMTRTPKAN